VAAAIAFVCDGMAPNRSSLTAPLPYLMEFATGTNTRKPCHEARASDHIGQKRKALSSRPRGFHVHKIASGVAGCLRIQFAEKDATTSSAAGSF